MDFGRIWVLRGLNRWADLPVIEAELDLGRYEDYHPLGEGSPFLPALACWPGPLDQTRLDSEANLADLLLFLTQGWQTLLEVRPAFGRVQRTRRPAFYRVLFAYDEEALARACLQAAFDFCQIILAGGTYDLSGRLRQLRHLAQEVRLGPSTGSIVAAALRRDIPARRLNAGSLVQLGWGCRQKRIWTAETDDTPAIAETIAQDKQLTRRLLEAVGVPVPYGRPVRDADDAWATAEEIGMPVVIKPQFGNQGRGVATNLSTREQVLRAYEASYAVSPHLVVEKHHDGADYRLLVVGGRLAAAALREPAHVVGDGHATITQLIDRVNEDPRRSDGHATALSWIKLDAIGLAVLSEQGFAPDSVPPAGCRVLIRRNANLSTGGTATDVTDLVHPAVAAHAVDAARAVGLDIAGVDVVAKDVRRPLDGQGVIVEVNAGPGLRMHLEPSAGTPRDVGAAVIDSLFPAGATGRIPVVAITGTNGKTTTTRILAHLLRAAGRYVGMTCTDGIYLDGRRTETRDCSGPQSARQVLLNPRVEVAVLETARGGILREGLGFDRCDVAIVTNIGKGDHLGLRGIETLEELSRVKEVVVRAVAPDGHAILNAADPLVVGTASAVRGRILFFSRDAHNPIVRQHLARGGRAVLAHDNRIVLAEGSHEEPLAGLEEVPFTHGGRVPFQVENALAATAAGWCLGLSREVLAAGLRSFRGGGDEVPGRFNVLPAGEALVIVDYAHNPSAVAALIEGLRAFPQAHRTLIFSGCNRRDVDLVEMGEQAGQAFDRVILYADRGHSGRTDGELNRVLRQGLARAGRVAEVVEMASEREALESALRALRAGELLVAGVETIEESLDFVQRYLYGGNIKPTRTHSAIEGPHPRARIASEGIERG
jgi:cyanophycin synthetase